MRATLIVLLAGIAAAAAAQDPTKSRDPDKDAQTRIRAEHSAGGLGKVTPQERANADVGAGPHLERHTDPARREPREDSSKQVESKDERRDTRRP
jgi:hypothetical protein